MVDLKSDDSDILHGQLTEFAARAYVIAVYLADSALCEMPGN